jgi:hypothetical protein
MPNPDRKQVILHIGAPKTGTTSLQTFFSRNRDRLLSECHLWYPLYAHDRHAILGKPTTGNGASIARLFNRAKCPPEDWESARKEYLQSLELHEKLLYSSENFFGLPEERWPRVREFFGDSVSVVIVVYVRPQVAHLFSAYGQAVRNSGFHASYSKFIEDKKGLFLFHMRSRMLRRIFGERNVIIRPFLPAAFKDGGLIVDFMSSLGIGTASFTDVGIKENPSIDNAQIFCGRLINQLTGNRTIAGQIAELTRELDDSYRSFEQVPLSALIERDDIARIAEFFAEDNESLCAAEFGGRWNFNEENARTAEQVFAELNGKKPMVSAIEVVLLCHIARLEKEVRALRSTTSGESDESQRRRVQPRRKV